MRNHLVLPLLFLCVGLFAQDRIALDNPSFEDTPRAGALPSGWDAVNCGPPDQTPPDIHPNDLPPYHFFGVKLRAYEGWSYLGMVVRETGSQEAVTQDLAIPLEANGRYAFSLFLARSDTYVSGIPGDAYRQADFTQPAVLQIWGGMEPCETGELLALTVPVENTSWLEYAFTLAPTQPWTYLTFEASWEGDRSYNGHILLDDCSSLVTLPKKLTREELEAMDAEALEKTALETIEKYQSMGMLSDLTEVPHMGVCYKTRQFEKQVEETGLRRLVMNTPFAALSSDIRALEAIRLEKNLALLKEVTRLSLQDSKEISPTEYQYFERADMTFRENEAVESIRAKRLEYIQLHRGELIGELVEL